MQYVVALYLKPFTSTSSRVRSCNWKNLLRYLRKKWRHIEISSCWNHLISRSFSHPKPATIKQKQLLAQFENTNCAYTYIQREMIVVKLRLSGRNESRIESILEGIISRNRNGSTEETNWFWPHNFQSSDALKLL